MRVVYVINGLGTGGTERSLAELMPVLRGAGVALTVVCLHRRAEGVEHQVRDAGFDVRFLHATGWIGRVRELRRLLRQERPDVVHTTIFESDVIGRLAAARTGCVVVSSLVNTSYDRSRLDDRNVSAVKLWAARQVDGWTARHLTHHLHAITDAVRTSSARALGLDVDRISVVERGRDPARLGRPSPERRLAARRALRVDDDAEVVINVGRQEHQKGQVDLLRAVDMLAARRPTLVLIQAGRRGHASPELDAVTAAPSLAGRVRFLGHREDVPELLAAADVFAFPSRYEGFGGAVIEAMALGLPIVTTTVPALLEVVEPDRNALVVPPGRPDLLADAVELLLDDATRRASFGARGRAIFLERFTLERAAHRLLRLYEEVGGTGQAPAGQRPSG